MLRDRLARVVRLDLAAAHLMGLLGRCVDRIAETRAHERARERDAQIGAVRAADGAKRWSSLRSAPLVTVTTTLGATATKRSVASSPASARAHQ